MSGPPSRDDAITILKPTSPEVPPSGQDVERFLIALPLSMDQRRLKDGVPNIHTIDNHWRLLQSILKEKFESFSLTAKEHSHVKSVLAKMRKTAAVSSTPRPKAWLTARNVSTLSAALLRDAEENGTTNWDHVLQRMLSLVLLACLAARAGEISQSSSDSSELHMYMKYEDVTGTRLVGSQTESKFHAACRNGLEIHKGTQVRDSYSCVHI